MRAATANTRPSGAASPGWRAVAVVAGRVCFVWLGGFEDSPFGLFLLTVDAPGLDAEQHIDCVTCPLRDLGWRHSGVEPGGDGCVPEIVGAAGEQGFDFGLCERGSSGSVEDSEVCAVGNESSARQAEEATAGTEAEFFDVAPNQPCQFWVHRHGPGVIFCPVLEFASLAHPAVVGHWEPLRGCELVSRNSPQPVPGMLTRLMSRRSVTSSGRIAA